MYFKGDIVKITGELPQKGSLVMVTNSGQSRPIEWLRVDLDENHQDVSIAPEAVERVSIGDSLRVDPNMTLLEFLETGGEIILPNGAWLRGDPQRRYIEHGVSGGRNLGLWHLNAQGFFCAVSTLEDVINEGETE